MNYLHSSVNTPIRTALKKMLREFDASHVFTLAFHEQINMQNSIKKIERWYRNVMHRLFGRHCFQLPPNQTIEFLLLPEGGSANLHFHGLIRVPHDRLAHFERYGLPHWKRIAQKGTHDFRLIDSAKRDEYFSYITKGMLATDVLHSSMLHDFGLPPTPLQPDRKREIYFQQTRSDIAKVLPDPAPNSALRNIDIY